MGSIPDDHLVLRARRSEAAATAPFAPAPIDEVVESIRAERPDLVFAPHVETASGMILPDEYISAVADAVHEVGGMMVLDCIASGAIWVDMQNTGVDVLISAPQKGWSGSPCCGLVMLSKAAREAIDHTTSSSFACDLRKWLQIMEAYESGGHAYHATMPTDGLRVLRNVMLETREFGFEKARQRQQELGDSVRALLEAQGFQSVSAPGYQAPGVVVSYTSDAGVHNGSKFRESGLQIAAGVPLQCDEGDDYQSFRIGLFGLDKLYDVAGTVARLESSLKNL